MRKVGEDFDHTKIVAEFLKKVKDGKIAYAMLAYIDTDGEMFMYGDSHSITNIIVNTVANSLHKDLSGEEHNYEQRKDTGGFDTLKGFVPDDAR